MVFISGKEKLSGRDEIRYIANLLSYPFNLVIYKGREQFNVILTTITLLAGLQGLNNDIIETEYDRK